VHLIRTGLRDHVHLAAGLSSVLDVIKGAIYAILLDCVLRDLQPGLRLLRLLLDAAGVHAVNLKVVIVASAADEADGALIASAIVLREWRQQRKAGPVAPVVWKIGDLILADDGRCFGETTVGRVGSGFDLDSFGNRTNIEFRVQSAGLADLQLNVPYDMGFEAVVGNRHDVATDRKPGKAVITVRVRPLLLSDTSICSLDLHVRSNQDGSCRVGHSPFQHCPINLSRRYRAKQQNRKEH